MISNMNANEIHPSNDPPCPGLREAAGEPVQRAAASGAGKFDLCDWNHSFTALVILLAGVWCVDVSAAENRVAAVATFESIGLYYDVSPGVTECSVSYRPASNGEWRDGYPLVYSARDKQCRGSLVGLEPNTLYDIRLKGGGEQTALQTRTRGETFRIGKTTQLPHVTTGNPLHIREGGSENAWHLVTPAPGGKFVSDVLNKHDANVIIEADYVILRGVELRNAQAHGVLIRPGVQNVIIEDCHITGWGRIGGAAAWGVRTDMDSGIFAETGAGRLVVQRNLIEYPRSGSNDWESGHPDGPQGISLVNSSGGNVIRYNTIRSTEDHGFNDGIGGGSNFSLQGSPNRDSDIYGNIISNCWDDCIESEGANMNVRIWSNYIHHSFVGIATAATSMGPLYVFRNVIGESRVSHNDPAGGAIFKVGGRDVTTASGEKVSAHGPRFFFHNTVLQPKGPLDIFGGGAPRNCVTRNNILYGRGRGFPPARGDFGNDFQNDLTGSGGLAGGLVKSMFLPSERPEWFLAPTMTQIHFGVLELVRDGNTIRLSDAAMPAKNPALDTGARLPGFNDGYTGSAPDIGAFENGRPPLRFGREMAPGFTRAPWEMY